MIYLPYIYFAYMFISLYMLSLFILIFVQNRKTIFEFPPIVKKYSVSFIVPAYNEEKTIEDTINHILNVDYPNVIEVIIINDCSTDRTLEIAKKLMEKYSKIKILDNKKNLGKAEGMNMALRIAKGELVAVVDADSYPEKNSLSRMIGFFDNEKVGAVTCPIFVRKRDSFLEKLQAIEYKVIAFTRKLFDYVDSIYVTPGPLAIYRKNALLEIGGFDKNNLTEDIEATWHLIDKGWERRMCLSTSVSTTAPKKIKQWYIQRRRWNMGGLQCIYKYRRSIGKKGIFGWFIIPSFILSTFLGLVGLFIFFYLMSSRIISNFLLTKYSIIAETPLVTLNNFYIIPSVLNYFGIVLFLFGLVFTLIVLSILKEEIFIKENILNIPFYMVSYLAFYPFVMLGSIFHMIRGKKTWR